MQAIHDILEHRDDLRSYDHIQFQGVVPRTFLCAFVTAAFALPLRVVASYCGLSNFAGLYITRLTLMGMSFMCLRRLCGAIHARAGLGGAWAFALVFVVQFHLPFYASRALPNTFALQLSSLALAAYIEGQRGAQHRWACGAVQLLSVCAAVVRCEIVLWLLCLCLQLGVLPGRSISPFRLARWVAAAAVPAVVLSVSVDSALWQGTSYTRRVPYLNWPLIWPEGMVFYFNGVDQRSQEWGVSPWHWYVTSALPRAVPIGLLGVILGLFFSPARGRLGNDLIVWTAPICGLSLLGHKEVRFIFPSLLAITALGAVSLVDVLENLGKYAHRCRRVITFIVGLCVAACGLSSGARLVASIYNYPAGHALWSLGQYLSAPQRFSGDHGWAIHPVVPLPVSGGSILLNFTALSPLGIEIGDAPSGFLEALHVFEPLPSWAPQGCLVHVDAQSAMSGISRYVHPDADVCGISKEEFVEAALTDGAYAAALLGRDFDFAVSGRRELPGFNVVAAALAYRRFDLRPLLSRRGLPRVSVAPEIFVHQRQRPGSR